MEFIIGNTIPYSSIKSTSIILSPEYSTISFGNKVLVSATPETHSSQ